MERESLLTVLIVLLGGIALHAVPLWPAKRPNGASASRRESLSWRKLWLPIMPLLTMAACLCGWALASPDPVPAHVGAIVFAGCASFAVLFVRAAARAIWALLPCRRELYIATVGVIRPRIVISQALAEHMDPRALEAALEHERAHARHRDPLRIWLAELVTDLQWPRRAARLRLRAWLAALEQARDDEARACGIDGVDLAAAVLASLRYRTSIHARACAQVTGDRAALRERIARLLAPLPQPSIEPTLSWWVAPATIASVFSIALLFGLTCGGRVVGLLLAISS